MSILTRRDILLGTTALTGGSLFAQSDATGPVQGSASRGVRAQPRAKPSGIPFLAQFTDIAASAGLTHPVIYGGTDRADYILEATGCGVAFFDYDNDGWLDLLVLNGTRLDVASVPPGTTNRLYKNNRDGTFTDVTEKAGLVRSGWAAGVTIGDYNNDGFEDIFITYYGQNVLYRNNGDGTFTDVTKAAGLLHEGTRWGSGCTFIDYDKDGHLDLFVGNYVDFDIDKVGKPGANRGCTYKTWPVFCGPRGLTPPRQYMYRNNGDGTFREATEAFGLLEGRNSFAMSAVAADLDNDGWPDIFVACDSTPSFFFHNRHNGTFHDDALERGIALAENGQVQAGMGVAVGDFNLDGNLDLFKTHFAEDTSELYVNDGTGNFEVATLRAGLGVETKYVGWGAGMVDLDNDGWPDIFLVTGAPSSKKALIEEQRHWITYIRDICQDVACLQQAYTARIEVLSRNEQDIINKLSCEMPEGGTACMNVVAYRDPSIRIHSFNQSLAQAKHSGKIIGCSRLINLPVGTVGSNNSFGGTCTLQDGSRRKTVEICDDDMFGHFELQAVEPRNVSDKNLVDFTHKHCFGG